MSHTNSMHSWAGADVLPNVMHKGTETRVKLKQCKVGKKY